MEYDEPDRRKKRTRRNKKDSATLFVDATNECVKVTNNNKLTPENIARIVDAYAKREDVPNFCRLVKYEEIRDADYNLSVSAYVESEDAREVVDVRALNEEIAGIVSREDVLRKEIDAIIQNIETKQERRTTLF